MNVRYIKSATVVIEHNGTKVLCDPWLTDGIYYGSWFHWPPMKFTADDFKDVDYIYISHVHPDHCDAETLKHLTDKTVLICDFHEKFLLNTLKKIGFKKIIEVANRGTVQLGKDFSIEVIAADDAESYRFAKNYGHSSLPTFKKSIQIDSMAVFASRDRVVVNSNDVPVGMIYPTFPYLKSKYGKIDLLLVSYAGAGPFPQAYELPRTEMADKAVRAAYGFLSSTIIWIKELAPRFYLPYAGQYTLGGRLHWMNSYKGTAELDELILDLVPVVEGAGSRSQMVLLDQGESFDVDTDQASGGFTPTDFLARQKYAKEVLSEKKFTYEIEENAKEDFLPRLEQARQTLWAKQKEYNYFSDCNITIDVGHAGYKIPMNGDKVERADSADPSKPFVLARLDPRLLSMILDRRANWNNAEIGSHITLNDWIPGDKKWRSYDPMPHHMMAYLQEPKFSYPTGFSPAAR